MKRILFLLLFPIVLFAQGTSSSASMIGIAPLVNDQQEIQKDVRNVLRIKLMQMATSNGFASQSSQFVIAGSITLLDKQVTPTAPPQIMVDLEVSFYVADLMEKKIFSETSYRIKGVDNNENRAMVQAINSISSRNAQIKNFMDQSRAKIMEYYTTKMPDLLQKAEGLARQKKYDEALAMLSRIPDCVDNYSMVLEQMTTVYSKRADQTSAQAIQDAKAKIALRDYKGAVELLSKVDPSSSSASEAAVMMVEISKGAEQKEQREVEQQARLYEERKEEAQRARDSGVQNKSRRIESSRKAASEALAEEVKKEETVSSASIKKWLFGKLK